LINPLIIVRDIHLASSVMVAGIVFFDLLVASPVLRNEPGSKAESSFRGAAGRLLWASLALSIISALAWLGLLSARIADKAIADVVIDGTAWMVLTQTQFGFAWQIRLLLACLLAACLPLRRKPYEAPAATWLLVAASLLAGAYLGALAFAGHGAEGLGSDQNIHLAADILHLNAAGLWLGALVPLALLLVHLRRSRGENWVVAAAAAGGRFSTLGILAVGILLVSGTINAAFLLGGMHSLIDTVYGRLLLLKIALFAAMVSLAAINRQRLLPRLSVSSGVDLASRSVDQLVRSALAEIALGVAIILVVGLLGIMPPANEIAAHLH
jgi:putative copper resistance protein D